MFCVFRGKKGLHPSPTAGSPAKKQIDSPNILHTSCAAAPAKERKTELVTADEEFQSLEKEIKVNGCLFVATNRGLDT